MRLDHRDLTERFKVHDVAIVLRTYEKGSRDGVQYAVVFFKSLLEAQIELRANLSASLLWQDGKI